MSKDGTLDKDEILRAFGLEPDAELDQLFSDYIHARNLAKEERKRFLEMLQKRYIEILSTLTK